MSGKKEDKQDQPSDVSDDAAFSVADVDATEKAFSIEPLVEEKTKFRSVMISWLALILASLALAAVGGLGGQASIALAADHLLALVGAGKGCERGLNFDAANTATAETQHQVEGRLLLDVVVRKSAAILELLAGEDQTLLIGGDTLLVLDLCPEHE